MVAHFEQVRRQQLRVDLAAGGGVGVPGQQGPCPLVLQGEHQAVVVHRPVQGGQPLPEALRLLGVEQLPYGLGQVLRLPPAGGESPGRQTGAGGRAVPRRQLPQLHTSPLRLEGQLPPVLQGPGELPPGGVFQLHLGQLGELEGQSPVQGLPQLTGSEALQHREQAAHVVLVDVGADHHVDVVQPPPLQLPDQRGALGQLRWKLLRLAAAPVQEHDKAPSGPGGVGALRQNGLPVSHIEKRQRHAILLIPWPV